MSDVPEAPDRPPPPPDLFSSPSVVPQPPPPLQFERITFTGTGAEYFRIWIVNLALTIITLGVFSAWAKVRRLQYFYRHTRLAGAGFDYHGDPIAILKGRIIALILFGLYSAIGYVNLWVAIAIVVGLAVAVPWLLRQSIRFRLHNSSYRGIRFRFHGTTKEAYWIFLALPIFTVFTFGLLGPFWHHRLKRYEFSNASFGRARFAFRTGVGEFYVTYIFAVFMFFCLVAGIVGVLMAGTLAMGGTGGNPNNPELSFGLIVLLVITGVLYSLAIIAIQSITAARIQNDCWNQTRTDHHTFESQMSAWRLFVIEYTNLWATVLTLGLFRPFAQVRVARYVAETLVVAGRGFEAYEATAADDISATGEEVAEFFDFDVAF